MRFVFKLSWPLFWLSQTDLYLQKAPIRLENGRYVTVEGRKKDEVPSGVAKVEGLVEAQPVPNGDLETLHNTENLRSASPQPTESLAGDDDDNMTQATRTDDDLIRQAFDTALDVSGMAAADEDEDDDDDQIIWSPPK